MVCDCWTCSPGTYAGKTLPSGAANKQSRYLFLTIHTDESFMHPHPPSWDTFGDALVHGIYNKERGGAGETPHWQCWLEFNKVVRPATVIKRYHFPPTTFIRASTSTTEAGRDKSRSYCRKGEGCAKYRSGCGADCGCRDSNTALALLPGPMPLDPRSWQGNFALEVGSPSDGGSRKRGRRSFESVRDKYGEDFVRTALAGSSLAALHSEFPNETESSERHLKWLQTIGAAKYAEEFDEALRSGDKTRKVYILFGDAGTGKTYHVQSGAFGVPPRYTGFGTGVYQAGQNIDYNIGYEGQRLYLADDCFIQKERDNGTTFVDAKISHSEFLLRTQDYPYTVNAKYGSRPWLSEYIVFTSNADPRTWFQVNSTDFAALFRRVDYIYEAKGFYPNVQWYKHVFKDDEGRPFRRDEWTTEAIQAPPTVNL